MSIVAVSDVHLGMEGANEGTFIEFLEHLDFEEVENLVLLGDIIDLWRRDFTNAFIENAEVLKLISEMASKTKVHYVIGNHDYYLLRLSEINGQNFSFEVSKSLTLKNESEQPSENHRVYYFTHGYQLEVLCNPYYKPLKTYEAFSEQLCLAGDEKGNAAEQVWKMIQSSTSFLETLKRIPEDPKGALKSMMEPPEEIIQNYDKHYVIDPMIKLAESDIRHFLMGIKPNQFLVYGHTHYPTDFSNHGDSKLKNVANTGCWGIGEDEEFWYLEIEGNEVYNRVYKS